jgi:alkylation response protein AidB-like acyl-CoA dehydrogenase
VNLGDAPGEAAYRARLVAWLDGAAGSAPQLDPIPTDAQLAEWRAWSRRLYEAGYAGITWAVADGGQGLPHTHQAIWLQESARAGVPDHLGIIGLGMAGPTIAAWGSAEQRQRFLPPLLRAEEIWCQGFSEPGSGSDLASVRTRAVADGSDWVVTGQKIWSSFAHMADWCILLVRTEPETPDHRALSYLVLDMRSPGVRVVPVRQLTGDPEFNEIFLDDVRVPRTSMLGAPGEGWKVAMTTLSHERGTHGVGLAARLEADMTAALARLIEPREDGTAPMQDPLVADQFVALWVELRALQITNLRSLSTIARTGAPGPESTISKLRWSELNQRLAALLVEQLGPAGLEQGGRAIDGGRWSFARLRTRGNTIEAGTSEILRNIIAERVVGLPRAR